jgi:hypothetical protein
MNVSNRAPKRPKQLRHCRDRGDQQALVDPAQIEAAVKSVAEGGKVTSGYFWKSKA